VTCQRKSKGTVATLAQGELNIPFKKTSTRNGSEEKV